VPANLSHKRIASFDRQASLGSRKMTKRTVCRIVGGILVVLIGVAVGFGGFQLWGGAPSSWPNLIADASTIRSAAVGMLALAVFLVVAGTAATVNLRWGQAVSAIGILVFVAGGFWVNYALFGDVRLTHSGANVVVAAVILLLLSVGARR
jgi:hypothetical protein